MSERLFRRINFFFFLRAFESAGLLALAGKYGSSIFCFVCSIGRGSLLGAARQFFSGLRDAPQMGKMKQLVSLSMH